MAVVFISPKKRQKMFFVVITLGFLAFLLIVSLGVFLSKPKEADPVLVLNKSKVNIDMSVFDSEKFTNLQSIPEMGWQYKYTVTNRNKRTEEGFISAPTEEKATELLRGMGFTVNSIEKVAEGRDNPFVQYYTVVVVTPPAPQNTPPASEAPAGGGQEASE